MRFIDSLIRWILILTLALLPVFFLPLTQNFFDTAKWILLVAGALIVLFLTGLRLLLTGDLTLNLNAATNGFGALFLAGLISLLIASTNKIEALLMPWGITTFAALVVLFLCAGHLLGTRDKRVLRTLLLVMAVLNATVAIIQFSNLSKLPVWIPLGSSITLVLFLILVLPLLIEDLIISLQQKNILVSLIWMTASTVLITGLSLTLYQLVPVWQRLLLPLSAGWAITLETLKSSKQLFWGKGAENFIPAFTLGRPLYLNQGPLWNVLFSTNASLLLHLAVTWGLVGLGAGLLLIQKIIREANLGQIAAGKAGISALSISLLVAVVFLIAAPPVFPLLFVLALLLALSQKSTTYHWRLTAPNWWLKLGIVSFLAAAVATAGYFAGRAYAGEIAFYQSFLAAQNNRGRDVYNLQIQAIKLNPQVSRFHIAYSQTCLALANTLAAGSGASGGATESGQPRRLTEADQQTITALIQQAIREGKIAVQQAPGSAIAWENLARIYQALIPVTTGADAWAVASLQQTIVLDPTNALLRLNLGTVYVGQKNYDQAINLFLAAATLKPDYANAYYNLANALKLKGETKQAIAALEKTLSLIPTASSDYTRATVELEALKKAMAPPEGAPQPETSLTKPASTKPLIVPPLKLPEDTGPNIP